MFFLGIYIGWVSMLSNLLSNGIIWAKLLHIRKIIIQKYKGNEITSVKNQNWDKALQLVIF